jgi:hypothetical protein
MWPQRWLSGATAYPRNINMKRNPRSRQFRPIEKMIDAEIGQSLILAPLDFNDFAIMLEFEHLALRSHCGERRLSYFINENGGGKRYVCVIGPNGKNLPVARWLTGATRNQLVRYKNGNSFDLRPENLRLIDRGQNSYIAESRQKKAEIFGPYDPVAVAASAMKSSRMLAKRITREDVAERKSGLAIR